MKLLLDMNLSPRWVDYLADHGIEAAHWSSIASAAATDVEIMAYAGAHGHIVLTQDLDFSTILAITQGNLESPVLSKFAPII